MLVGARGSAVRACASAVEARTGGWLARAPPRGWGPAPIVHALAGESQTRVHIASALTGTCCTRVGAPGERVQNMRVRRGMHARPPQIVALGGGGFSTERDGSLLDDYVLSLTACARPRGCFLPTGAGSAAHYVVRFYRRFSRACDASHVSLFRRDQGVGGVEEDLATHLLAQDLISLCGG